MTSVRRGDGAKCVHSNILRSLCDGKKLNRALEIRVSVWIKQEMMVRTSEPCPEQLSLSLVSVLQGPEYEEVLVIRTLVLSVQWHILLTENCFLLKVVQ